MMMAKSHLSLLDMKDSDVVDSRPAIARRRGSREGNFFEPAWADQEELSLRTRKLCESESTYLAASRLGAHS
jgi:hypothetical protein